MNNPLALSNSHFLLKDAVAGAATDYEKEKRRIYSNLDDNKYDLLPFIVETCGGVSKAARKFCKELRRRRAKNIYGDLNEEEEVFKYGDPLLTAVNVEVQRSNSQMILERKPVPENLIESAFVKCEIAVSKRRSKVKERVHLKKKNKAYPRGCKLKEFKEHRRKPQSSQGAVMDEVG